jgi:hypothetical protein
MVEYACDYVAPCVAMHKFFASRRCHRTNCKMGPRMVALLPDIILRNLIDTSTDIAFLLRQTRDDFCSHDYR